MFSRILNVEACIIYEQKKSIYLNQYGWYIDIWCYTPVIDIFQNFTGRQKTDYFLYYLRLRKMKQIINDRERVSLFFKYTFVHSFCEEQSQKYILYRKIALDFLVYTLVYQTCRIFAQNISGLYSCILHIQDFFLKIYHNNASVYVV